MAKRLPRCPPVSRKPLPVPTKFRGSMTLGRVKKRKLKNWKQKPTEASSNTAHHNSLARNRRKRQTVITAIPERITGFLLP